MKEPKVKERNPSILGAHEALLEMYLNLFELEGYTLSEKEINWLVVIIEQGVEIASIKSLSLKEELEVTAKKLGLDYRLMKNE